MTRFTPCCKTQTIVSTSWNPVIWAHISYCIVLCCIVLVQEQIDALLQYPNHSKHKLKHNNFGPYFLLCSLILYCIVSYCPRIGELRTQKLRSHLMRKQSLKVHPLKPGVGQYIAMHTTLTARDFFLADFYLSSPFTCIFSKTSPEFSLC